MTTSVPHGTPNRKRDRSVATARPTDGSTARIVATDAASAARNTETISASSTIDCTFPVRAAGRLLISSRAGPFVLLPVNQPIGTCARIGSLATGPKSKNLNDRAETSVCTAWLV